jgi:DNA-binding PucR family transcriptional regulator
VFESAGFLSDLAGLTGGERVLPFMRRALGPLLSDDRCGGELLDTLHAYLISGGSPNQAGQLLGLHPSSVKYRLKVIRSLLGHDPLQDADVRFELELAVRLAIALRNLEPAA